MPDTLTTLAFRFRVRCPICHGGGRYAPPVNLSAALVESDPNPGDARWLESSKPCDNCRGTGYLRPLLRECPILAAGKGHWGMDCPECEGTGYVPLPLGDAMLALDEALVSLGYREDVMDVLAAGEAPTWAEARIAAARRLPESEERP